MKSRRLIIFLLACWPFIGTTAAYAGPTASELEETFIKVAHEVGMAVVSVSTVHVETVGGVQYFGPGGVRDPYMEEFLRQFFGLPPQMQYKKMGMGSGVIIDKEGHILTNEHVISGVNEIEVILPDSRKFKGKVLGSDPRSDLAVIKIDAPDLPRAVLGDSDQLKTGQWVLAIGNPFGFVVNNPRPSLTAGIISALHCSLSHIPGAGNRYYGDLIQTDAAINIGNSGGPLVNLKGEVIGINTLVFSASGGNVGIGFAIPINRAKAILDYLIRGEEISYGWLGASIQQLSRAIAEQFGISDINGALIFKVRKGSPADKGGLVSGDIIKGINGRSIEGPEDLSYKIGQVPQGTKITLNGIRDGKKKDFFIMVEKRPPKASTAIFAEKKKEEKKAEKNKEEIKSDKKASLWRDVKVAAITPEMVKRHKLSVEKGVIVEKMARNSPAYRSGLRPGDIIDEIARQPVRSIEDFNRLAGESKGKAIIHTDTGYVVLEE